MGSAKPISRESLQPSRRRPTWRAAAPRRPTSSSSSGREAVPQVPGVSRFPAPPALIWRERRRRRILSRPLGGFPNFGIGSCGPDERRLGPVRRSPWHGDVGRHGRRPLVVPGHQPKGAVFCILAGENSGGVAAAVSSGYGPVDPPPSAPLQGRTSRSPRRCSATRGTWHPCSSCPRWRRSSERSQGDLGDAGFRGVARHHQDRANERLRRPCTAELSVIQHLWTTRSSLPRHTTCDARVSQRSAVGHG